MKALPLILLAALPAAALDYKKDIMPIFEKKCFDCHSAAAEKLKGGLRLDDEEHFFKRLSKNDVVIPGDWDASYLFVTLILPEDEKGSMPPKDKGERLTEAEVRLVAQWIHEGARINGERGEKGSSEMDPEKILRFKDGKLLREGDEPAPDAKVLEPAWEEWTNAEGKSITAKFRGITADKVTLELKTGKQVTYPLAQLSKESQEKARNLQKM